MPETVASSATKSKPKPVAVAAPAFEMPKFEMPKFDMPDQDAFEDLPQDQDGTDIGYSLQNEVRARFCPLGDGLFVR